MNTELSRRQMLLMSALAAASFTPVGRALAAQNVPVVDAGALSAYGQDGIYDQFAQKGFFVIRKDGRLVAQSSVCTHKRGKLTPVRDGFYCKSHGSAFASDGKVTRPPAKADLVRYAVSLDAKKHVLVDTSKRIERGQFGAAGAYVDVAGM